MGYRLLADAVLAVHFLFIVFVIFGGLLAIRWPRAAWIHLPCLAWGAAIVTKGWVCPLTPLEVRLRRLAGEAGYEDSFIEHYILGLVYPGGLTAGVQAFLGGLLVAFNLVVYGVVWWAWRGCRR